VSRKSSKCFQRRRNEKFENHCHCQCKGDNQHLHPCFQKLRTISISSNHLNAVSTPRQRIIFLMHSFQITDFKCAFLRKMNDVLELPYHHQASLRWCSHTTDGRRKLPSIIQNLHHPFESPSFVSGVLDQNLDATSQSGNYTFHRTKTQEASALTALGANIACW